jgi:hypothetical protein
MRNEFDSVQPISRRSFLRGSSLALLSSVVASRFAFASQEGSQQPLPAGEDDKTDKQQGAEQANASPEQAEKRDSEPAEHDQVTKTDADGREYRVCPECGGNMYRQDKTWTCENCGYAYTE